MIMTTSLKEALDIFSSLISSPYDNSNELRVIYANFLLFHKKGINIEWDVINTKILEQYSKVKLDSIKKSADIIASEYMLEHYFEVNK